MDANHDAFVSSNVEPHERDYRYEQIRLNSFERWPINFIEPAVLAAAGFYYTQTMDRVRCFECLTEIFNWEPGDNPMTEHQRWGGRCRFIRKLPCGNIQISSNSNNHNSSNHNNNDHASALVRRNFSSEEYGLIYRLLSEDDTNTSSASPSLTPEEFTTEHGFEKKIQSPKFPQYLTCEQRLKSFEEWPSLLGSMKNALIASGFFYENIGDRTVCYSCGVMLKNWQLTDDPWEKHAEKFSNCSHVTLLKSNDLFGIDSTINDNEFYFMNEKDSRLRE